MKKYILTLLISGLTVSSLFAQEEKEPDAPVSNPFESGILIDAQTTVIPDAKTLEFVIQHKFGSVENGSSDLFGIYGSSNIRVALNYVPVKNFQFGAGITKRKMMTDLNAKWTIFKQTERSTVPVSVALYGAIGIDGRSFDQFDGMGFKLESKKMTSVPESFEFTDRLSYYSQLIVGRKVCDAFSLQVGASFTHYNTVDWDNDHDIIGLHANARLKFSPQGSLIVTYDHPLKVKDISEQYTWDHWAEPSLAVGVEFFTFTHAFQMFVGTADGILPMELMMNNHNPIKGKSFAIGFTITRLWMF